MILRWFSGKILQYIGSRKNLGKVHTKETETWLFNVRTSCEETSWVVLGWNVDQPDDLRSSEQFRHSGSTAGTRPTDLETGHEAASLSWLKRSCLCGNILTSQCALRLFRRGCSRLFTHNFCFKERSRFCVSWKQGLFFLLLQKR